MASPQKSWPAFDPHLERFVLVSETSSHRIRAKLRDAQAWCFCDLCWRPTEYSTTLDRLAVVKRLSDGNAKIVPITGAIREAARNRTDALVMRYEQALNGELGPYQAARMWRNYCDVVEMRGDRSVEGFHEHVERRMLLSEWARYGEVVRLTKLPSQAVGSAKASKLYCEVHNPRRSKEARQAYQRDRRFTTEYEKLIEQTWQQVFRRSSHPDWDIETLAYVRREAFRKLKALKMSPTSMIESLLTEGKMSQAKIARQLGISRQAVSAAIRRRGKKQTERPSRSSP
ncbi:MarR family transcriptional regulator [Acidisoma sp. 7E03]